MPDVLKDVGGPLYEFFETGKLLPAERNLGYLPETLGTLGSSPK